ncbi:phytase [Pontibacter qinzhouensis]|uniref:Phytase n=1 Tax=Pontibacter qinzhouensis TaxID=2603253 RepID=A0A5C8K659_9BACT|nr:phytase [Pontibacter qinzhouensis]TXK46806.1 phytase [Pontibacter qinzhouensis]
MKNLKTILPLAALFSVTACSQPGSSQSETSQAATATTAMAVVKPVVVTDTVRHDTDDPAIWINAANPSESLVLGTDKNEDGALYVFDLEGKIIKDKVVRGLKRPNNVDVAYGFMLNGQPVDIAVVTERMTHKLRIFTLPDMRPIDNGGIEVYEGETDAEFRDLMGIAMYTTAAGEIHAIAGRKTGPTDGTYLWQYRLEDNGQGAIKATVVRKFGQYSGQKEIEAIAVDNELGYIYYSDEGIGVRKYYADPAKGNNELALFATTGFGKDHEGISIYKIDDGTGYILVSDQGNNRFHVFPREGAADNPHQHNLLKMVNTSTLDSDGSDVTSVSLDGKFRNGLFVAMSTDKTFQYYRWEDIAGKDLKVATNGESSSLAKSKF